MNKSAVSFRAIADANIHMHPRHHTTHTPLYKTNMRIVNDENTIYKRERQACHFQRNNLSTIAWSRESK